MAAVVKAAKTIRNNWKKSVFFTGLAAYGVKYAQRKYDESELRKAYCLEAKAYGDQPLRTGERARKVTVFLNPAAQNGSCRKLYEKNVHPILNLAGLEVTVVKTEYEGQAKKYMDVLDPVDAIVVAGGNGTLLEVVTGLFRRKDHKEYSKIPIGVMPCGHTNRAAETLVNRGMSDVRWLLESAMSVVRNHYQSADVMAIKAEKGDVYAVSSIEWGSFKEAEERKKKNWYFGPLKHWWTYLRCAMKTSWPPEFCAAFSSQSPCEGCSRCYVAPVQPAWRWWHILIPPQKPAPQKDYSGVDNPDCGIEHALQFDGMEFVASTRNHVSPTDGNLDGKAIDIEIGPGQLSRTEFVSEGWRRVKKDEKARALNTKLVARSFKLTPQVPEGAECWFSIDGEQYETMPVEVELWPDAIFFFHEQTSHS